MPKYVLYIKVTKMGYFSVTQKLKHMTVRIFYHFFFGPMHASIYGQHFFWQAVSHDSIKDEQKHISKVFLCRLRLDMELRL